jgi:hypothetical protein
MSGEQTEGLVRAIIINKRTDYERDLKQSGRDGWKEETEGLIRIVQDNYDSIYKRRKEIEGAGIVWAEGKMWKLFQEAKNSYLLGHYYATIALSGMAAERICFDYIDFSEIQINGKTLSDKAKQELINLPLRHLINFLYEYGIIDDKSKKVLHRIADIRNATVHPKMLSDPKKDAIEVLNKLCKVAENLLSMFRFYDLVNGRFVKRPQPRNLTDQSKPKAP